jgi:hypothetical protein
MSALRQLRSPDAQALDASLQTRGVLKKELPTRRAAAA